VGSSELPWAFDGQGSDGDREASTDQVTPPTNLLWAAGATALVSLLLWIPGTLLLHVAGYVLSSFVTLGLLAAFKRRDLRARQSAFYSPRSELSTLSVAVAVVAVAGAMGHVWVIATFWAG
jgi:hypothetical protein